MPYPTPFLRLTAFGRMGSAIGAETWSCNFKFAGLADTTNPTPFMTAAAPVISTFHSDSGGTIGTSVFLTELHGAIIGTDGKYVGGATQATKIYTYPTPVAGGGVPKMPWSTACVLSLRNTARTRGPGSHGRIYWPYLGGSCSPTTGRFIAQAAFAGNAAIMLNALNTLAKTHLGPGVSLSNMSKVGSGVQVAVNQVLVGDRPDSQERRENASGDVYIVSSVTP